MNCPQCHQNLKEIEVRIQDADSPVTSYQCGNCGYFDFEKKSMNRAITEIKTKDAVLKIKQRIIKLSQDRLGIYFNNNVVRSLGIRGGEEVYLSVPDRKHIVVELEH